jgi:hypothetical protein
MFGLGVVGACDKVVTPGDVANPKLAELMTEQIETWRTRNTGDGLSATSQQGVLTWFQEIQEVVVKYVKTSTSKFSHFTATIRLHDKTVIEHDCGKNALMVVRFQLAAGKATNATRNSPMHEFVSAMWLIAS